MRVADGPAWSIDARGARVDLRLTPKSSRDEIVGLETLSNGRQVFKARVRAAPEDGKANEALRRVLAGALGAAPSSVTLASGATSRIKSLTVAGDPDALQAKLAALAAKQA